MKPGTQCHRLYLFLDDLRWHSTAEILNAVPCIVHSRIADLRRWGLIVEHRTVGPGAKGSLYRLVGDGRSALSERGHPAALTAPQDAGGTPSPPRSLSAPTGAEDLDPTFAGALPEHVPGQLPLPLEGRAA